MKSRTAKIRHEQRISTGLEQSLSRYALAAVGLAAVALPSVARANFSGPYDVSNWTFQNSGGSTDGNVNTSFAPAQIFLTGGRTQSGTPGTTDFTIAAVSSGLLTFHWAYFSSSFVPTDGSNFLLNGVPTLLAVNSLGNNAMGDFSVFLNQGDIFGFEVFTLDNAGDPGGLRITNFNGPVGSAVPESTGTLGLLALGVAGIEVFRRRRASNSA
jgi:hypothetical protein